MLIADKRDMAHTVSNSTATSLTRLSPYPALATQTCSLSAHLPPRQPGLSPWKLQKGEGLSQGFSTPALLTFRAR